VTKREQSWELLRYLSKFQPCPWLCVGDFNEIISLSDDLSILLIYHES